MTTDVLSFTDPQISVRWMDTYVSDGLNRKAGAVDAPGVYRGFLLTTSVSNRTVSLKADPTYSDHAANLLLSAGTHAIAIKKDGGDFSIDLTAYAGKTVVIALYATYAVSATTVAKIRVYEYAPTDEYTIAVEKPTLVVLGVVRVPAALSVIAQEDITHGLRLEAWERPGQSATLPKQLIRNGSFEFSRDQSVSGTGASEAFFWKRSTGLTTNGWRLSSGTTPTTYDNRYLDLRYDGLSAISSKYSQTVFAHVRTGNVLRLKLKYRVLAVPTGGSFQVNLHFLDTDGAETIAVQTYTVPTSAISATFVTVDQEFVVAASATHLSYIEIVSNALTFAASGSSILVDEIELWVETRTPRDVLVEDQIQGVVTTLFGLIPDPAETTTAWATGMARSLLVSMSDASEPVVTAARRDAGVTNAPKLDWKGRARFADLQTDYRLARIETAYDDVATGVSPASLIWLGEPADGAGVKCRMYITALGELLFTSNASTTVNTTLEWTKDVINKPSWKWVMGTTDTTCPRLMNRASASNTDWLDTAWTTFWTSLDHEPSAAKNANFSFTTEYGFWPIDTSAGAVSGTLPTPASMKGKTILIKDTTGSFGTYAFTLVRNAAENINGISSSFVAEAPGLVLRVYSDGTNWWFV